MLTRMAMRSLSTVLAGMGSTPGGSHLSLCNFSQVLVCRCAMTASSMLTKTSVCRFTAPANLREGTSSVSQDIADVIFRMKMLGFNAIRLPMTFDNHWGLGQVSKCEQKRALPRWGAPCCPVQLLRAEAA